MAVRVQSIESRTTFAPVAQLLFAGAASAEVPAANPQRLTDAARIEKWFKRNGNDVLGRACTEAEKGDLIAWLTSMTKWEKKIMFDDRRRRWFDGIAWTAAAVALALLVDAAEAGAHRYPVDNAVYKAECVSCHVACHRQTDAGDSSEPSLRVPDPEAK